MEKEEKVADMKVVTEDPIMENGSPVEEALPEFKISAEGMKELSDLFEVIGRSEALLIIAEDAPRRRLMECLQKNLVPNG